MEQSVMIWTTGQFFGYELCRYYLEKETKVNVIYDGNQEEFMKQDRWFSIGRNADLTVNFENNSVEAVDFIYIDAFSYYLSRKWTQWTDVTEYLRQINQPKAQKRIMILPTQFHHYARAYKPMDVYYLPTLFGPGQPNSCLFQATIEQEKQSFYLDDSSDAIYVVDAVRSIVQSVESNTDISEHYLVSDVSESWNQCRELLDLSVNDVEKIQPCETPMSAVPLICRGIMKHDDVLSEQILSFKKGI